MSRLPITMALSGYHHTSGLLTGRVQVEGVDLNVLTLPVEEIFYRFTNHREWEVSEMSMGKFIALRSQGDESLVGIPVFPSRVFRHSSIYVRRDGVTDPRELAGARIGVPEWAQTAAVYSRGLLKHEYGVDQSTVQWFQAGVNEPGRSEKVALALPADVSLVPVPDRSLDDMLLSGDLDAVLSAHPPQSIEDGNPGVRRLFEDYATVERAYAAKTGIFPIMHVIAIRADVHAKNPWLANNLIAGFEEAKRQSIAELREFTASRIPVAWMAEHWQDCSTLLFGGDDYWPYGVGANRTTLAAFAQYAHEQGVAHRLMSPEELFPLQVQSHFKI